MNLFLFVSDPLVPATEELVAIFRELLEDDNYLDDEAWPTDEETIMVSTVVHA